MEDIKIVEAKELPPLRIMIGISILSYSHEFVDSFLKFWTELVTIKSIGRGLEVSYKFMYRKPVHIAQQALAEAALESNCTHLLLMDDDIYDVTVKDLVTLINADKDVIGGIMYTSGFPYAMCAFRRYDIKTRVADQPMMDGAARLYEIPPDQCVGVQEADLIPFGFTLIKTDVFKRLEKPYFTCDSQAPTDSWFMDSIMDIGVKPYACFDVWLNHRGCTRVTRQFLLNMEMEKARHTSSRVINLSQEDMTHHMLIMDLKMKDAELERQKKEAGDQKFISL